MTHVVDHLKKVSLTIRHAHHSVPFEFIVGTASGGLCPFEYELLHKAAGDRLQVHIPVGKLAPTLSHLQRPLCSALHLNAPEENLELEIAIVAVTDPQPREVIQAMAQAAEQQGCGGNCGCGCGGH
jgi:hypothetical protein